MKIESPLGGIIASLTHRYGGNVHDRGIVTVSGTVYDGNSGNAAKNVLDLSTDSRFCSKMEPNQWICYNFNDRRVRPTHYSINSWSSHYLRSWVLEGSIDNSNWKELDRHEGDPVMNSNHPIRAFTVPVFQEVDYRFIRLRQTGKNTAGNDHLIVTGFEVFGYLIE
jgi:hypothetical protein